MQSKNLEPPIATLNFILTALIATSIVSCNASNPSPLSNQPTTTDNTSKLAPSTDQANQTSGILELRANGEDFVRQGFLSKDGWQISFDHVNVNLTDVVAYQSDPPFDPLSADTPQSQTQASLLQSKIVDLAEGDATAAPILVNQTQAPPGRYNALTWKVTKADQGEMTGYALVLMGEATKDDRTIDFDLKIDREFAYACGDYVGDRRKGILEAGKTADVEVTFHFDHLFGDGTAPADDEINTGALGFEPLAKLADGQELDLDQSELEAKLAPEDYDKLVEIFPSLGHVGEGHCKES
jgi:hypothetical protein